MSAATYAVRLRGLEKPGERRYITRGDAYPQSVATYATREQAEAMATKCPAIYAASVIEWNVR